MKQLVICVGLLINLLSTHAQSGKLPPFRMMKPDGKIFKAEDLPMGKPIVLVYFDPGCDHCNALTKAMLAKQKELAKASVAFVTYTPVAYVKKFADQHQLSRFANM